MHRCISVSDVCHDYESALKDRDQARRDNAPAYAVGARHSSVMTGQSPSSALAGTRRIHSSRPMTSSRTLSSAPRQPRSAPDNAAATVPRGRAPEALTACPMCSADRRSTTTTPRLRNSSFIRSCTATGTRVPWLSRFPSRRLPPRASLDFQRRVEPNQPLTGPLAHDHADTRGGEGLDALQEHLHLAAVGIGTRI